MRPYGCRRYERCRDYRPSGRPSDGLWCCADIGRRSEHKPTCFSGGYLTITSPTPDTQYKGKEIFTVGGGHNCALGDHIWIFLKDIFGGYYVQNSPVELLTDGTWVATNIRPGRQIRYILAIYVSPDGNRLIRGWVRMNRWDRIEEDEVTALPGYVELARVPIRTPGIE